MVDEVLRALSPQFDRMYASEGRAVDSAREAAAGAVIADAVLDPQRAAADGRDRAVSQVRRVEPGGEGVGPDGVHREPEPAAGRLEAEVAKQFLAQVEARAKGWTSDEHFTVDGTLLEAWASAKSFQRKLS